MKVKQQKPASTNKRRNTDGSHVFLAGLSHDEEEEEEEEEDDDDDDDEEGETKRVSKGFVWAVGPQRRRLRPSAAGGKDSISERSVLGVNIVMFLRLVTWILRARSTTYQ
ncbi:hypothetical protein PABG_05063 [Paracoccidioides brasiliensis Pb03]|nr:hypothetical protein PABG_05063 [Paracoccidioides brasiliensis Pb03]